MAIVEPFAALRPSVEAARAVCELPYDVVSTEEARGLARDNPLSFLRVSKPEIGFPPGQDPYAPEVYARARSEFERLIQLGALRQDISPGFYVYRQTMGKHRQTGVVAVVSTEEYRQGIIRRHELTRPDKENDRVRHIEAVEAQTGPAFLTYRAQPAINALVESVLQDPAPVDYVAVDGIRHEGWSVHDPVWIDRLRAEFGARDRLYVADGHHRTAAAARVDLARQGRGGSDRFLAVIFPHDQMQILPYHRVVKDLAGRTPAEFLAQLQRVGAVRSSRMEAERGRREVGVYLAGGWHTLTFAPALGEASDPARRLDVALLQEHVLDPLLGIADPRTSDRIEFVGGIRGLEALEAKVESGQGAVAFAMVATAMEELVTVADAGGIMPPKSTWFEPKLRDGMFSHRLESASLRAADGV